MTQKRVRRTKPEQKNPLLELAGIGESKTVTLGLNVDKIYQLDEWVEKAVRMKRK